MTDIDLRPPEFNIWLLAGDNIDSFEVTVTDDEGEDVSDIVNGTWAAQIRKDRNSDSDLHATWQIAPNGEGTGVILSLDEGTIRSLHEAHAKRVRDPDKGPVMRYTGYWDVECRPVGGGRMTFYQGTFNVDADVTRLP